MQTQSISDPDRTHAVTVTGRYDLDLQNSGLCWTSTYSKIIAAAAADILAESGFYGPIEISYDLPPHMQVVTGVLMEATRDTLTVLPLPTPANPTAPESDVAATVEPVAIRTAAVRRLRA